MFGGSQWGLGGDCDPQGEVRHDEVQSVISAGWHCHMVFQSISSTVVTNNAVELVTATKGLGVRTSVISPLTYSNGDELITTSISVSI